MQQSPSSPHNQLQTASFSKNPMRKSVVSKISKVSGYSSILNTPNPDQNLQILRISLKKELDRKEKLQRLMEKYEHINVQEKSHIKAIKSNIIELKDVESNSKTKFYLNPIIYVDNNLSKDTREYLCMLLNTFYFKYDENSECQFKTKQLGKDMNELLQEISKNEENLLKIEKETIGVQVQLEGQLLGLKTKLKDESQRQKELEEQQKRIGTIYAQYEDKYNQQLGKVEKLRDHCQQLEEKICKLQQKVAEGETVKKGKEETMANQIAYQERFIIQLANCDEDIQRENEKEKAIKIKIKQKKLLVQQMKGKLNKLSKGNPQPSCWPSDCVNESLSTTMSQTQSRMSLTQIRKYAGLADSINSTLQMNRTMFSQVMKSKDSVDHQVGMKMVEIKTQNGFGARKERISVR